VRVTKDEADKATFRSFGEQIVAVVQAGKTGGRVDPRLAQINSRVMAAADRHERVGRLRGRLPRPPRVPAEIIEPVYENDPILSRVFRSRSDRSQSVTYNVIDETSRATGSRSGGMQVYWAAEADTATAKKPKLRQMKLEKKKLMGLAYLTEELMQDGRRRSRSSRCAFQKEFGFTVGNAVFRGGRGQPLGFMNSAAVVSQAIEASQTIANSASYRRST
jgi:HK97 family phage major capsid protein